MSVCDFNYSLTKASRDKKSVDADLESAIDKAGRDLVLSIVEKLGWGIHNPPPKFVWWDAVRMARQK